MNKEDWTPWGETFNNGFTYSRDLDCPNPECGWRGPTNDMKEWMPNIIGISTDPPPSDVTYSKPLAVITQCPKCFTKFWSHAMISFALTVEHHRELFFKNPIKRK